MTNIIPMPKEKKTAPSRKISKANKGNKTHKVKKIKGNKEGTEERVALIDSIKLTQGLLKEAYSCFHQTTDPDLLESYVYEINALKARHNYLSKQLRDKESWN